MNALRIRTRLTSHVVELPELEPLVGKVVEIIVLEEPEIPTHDGGPVPRAGSARGTVTMGDDFDAPLEDFGPYTR